jgi:hypothetical protein
MTAVYDGDPIMNPRIVAQVLALFALLFLATTVAQAAEAIDGTVESAGSGKISIKDKSGKVHSFEVDDSAKITLDGKNAKLDEVGVGSSASVTTETKNNKTVATMIIAKSMLDRPESRAATLGVARSRVHPGGNGGKRPLQS